MSYPVYPESVKIEALLTPSPVSDWDTLTNISLLRPGYLYKSGGSTAWDAGAISTATLPASGTDGSVEFRARTRAFVGLNRDTSPSVTSYSTVDYALYCYTTSNTLYYYENGSNASLGTWADGDILKIAVEGTNIVYYQNGAVLRTVAFSATNPFYVHVCMYGLTDYVDKIAVRGFTETWTELQDVQITTPITGHRGNEGTTQKDRVAASGSMSFQLNNAADNSGGLLGYYSPNNANCIPGWKVGVEIKLTVTYDLVPYVVFRGTVEAIVPRSGMYGERKVHVNCVDWMDEAAKARVRGLAIQVDKTSSEVFSAILAAVERQPPAAEIGAGIDEYPYALDNAFEGEVSVLAEFQRLTQSELGRAYVKADGTLVFEGRHTRPNAEVKETLTDADIHKIDASRGREEIINYSEVKAHPRRVDATATAVLFSLTNKPKIVIGETYRLSGLFRDEDAKASRVGGMNMVTPAASTDYEFHVNADETGGDLTDQLTVNVTYHANSAEYEIINNGPYDGYLTKLQARGQGIYAYEAVVVTAESQQSKDEYGEVGFPFDMPYQDDIRVAKDAADFIVQQSKALYSQVKGVTFIANKSDRLMKAALQREISDKVVIEEEVLGTAPFVPPGEADAIVPTAFFINAVRFQIGEGGVMMVRWGVETADPFNYWILDKTGYTELGETTRLAYGAFVPGWILGTSVLGTGTIVNS